MPSPLDADRWDQIEPILDRALDLPPDERDAYLDTACPNDAVRAEVDALLQAEADAPAFLDGEAAPLAASLFADEDAHAPSNDERRIGPYRLVEEIGRGGMSVVYRAERADGQFQRQVALKLLPRYFETERRIARFRAERQILADLDHPNIARLLDGGVTATGRPYLAMECVDGVPITTYCDAHGLPVDDRIDVLRTVCDALQHAHRQLVVHRDLKPSNILVTPEGKVKLLDFGIAKLLDEREVPMTVPITRTGEHWMTPEYAAPEQVQGTTVTTATDVYQLGVLAYELLTGQRPFAVPDQRLTAIEEAILERAPTPLATAARQAGRDPRTCQQLKGDLETIVTKALRKEPDRRYRSVEALANDLTRYLAGRPVTARPATWRYRARKFVRRHRGRVAAVAVIVALVLGYAATVTIQAQRIAHERNRATQEAAKSEQVSQFLLALFESSAPEQARGDTVTARDLLDRGVARANALRDQPLVQAQMFDVIGEVRRAYGDYEAADSLLVRALQLRRTHHDGPHPDVARSLRALSALRKDQGTFAAADSLLTASIGMWRALQDGPHDELATALSDLATLRSQQGNYHQADTLAREALTMRRALFDPPHEALAAGLNNLAAVYYRLDRLGDAAPLYEESLTMHRELLGADHPRVAALLNNLANLYDSMGRYDLAETYRRQSLDLDRTLFGSPHRYVASGLVSLGSILSARDKHAEAVSVLRDAVAMQRKLLGASHPDVAIALDMLGQALTHHNRYAEAEQVLRDALALRREAFDEPHPRLVNTLNALGSVSRAMARYDEAVAHYREAIAIQRQTVGNHGRKLAVITSNLGSVLRQQAQWTEAETAYRQSLALYRSLTPADTLGLAEVHVDLGSTLAEQGDWEEGGSHLRTGRRLLQQLDRPDHPALERATALLARAPQN